MRKAYFQMTVCLMLFTLFFPLSALADGNVTGNVQGNVKSDITIIGGGEIPPDRPTQAIATIQGVPAPTPPMRLKNTLWIDEDTERFFNLKPVWSIKELECALEDEIRKRLK